MGHNGGTSHKVGTKFYRRDLLPLSTTAGQQRISKLFVDSNEKFKCQIMFFFIYNELATRNLVSTKSIFTEDL